MHVIRLRGPWQYEPLARAVQNQDGSWSWATDGLPPSGTIEPPADWGDLLGQEFLGLVRFIRHFGAPTGLTENQQVWLSIAAIDEFARVHLNDQPIGELRAAELGRFEITRLLKPRNVLVIDIEKPRRTVEQSNSPSFRQNMPGGLIGEVRLEFKDG